MKLKPVDTPAAAVAARLRPARRRTDGGARFAPQLAAAARKMPPPASRAEAAGAPSPLVEVNARLFDLPVEARFSHAVEPNELKEIRLGVRVRRPPGDRFEVEAIVLDQAGRPVPDAVVLALADPVGSGQAAGGGFLPNTDVFGRTRGTIPAAARNVKLVVVTGNGLQTARELELPPD